MVGSSPRKEASSNTSNDDDDDENDTSKDVSEKSPLRRVKLYFLNSEGKWDDRGTGHVSCEFVKVGLINENCSFVGWVALLVMSGIGSIIRQHTNSLTVPSHMIFYNTCIIDTHMFIGKG